MTSTLPARTALIRTSTRPPDFDQFWCGVSNGLLRWRGFGANSLSTVGRDGFRGCDRCGGHFDSGCFNCRLGNRRRRNEFHFRQARRRRISNSLGRNRSLVGDVGDRLGCCGSFRGDSDRLG